MQTQLASKVERALSQTGWLGDAEPPRSAQGFSSLCGQMRPVQVLGQQLYVCCAMCAAMLRALAALKPNALASDKALARLASWPCWPTRICW